MCVCCFRHKTIEYIIMYNHTKNILAIAPTASISIICGGASPGIEPIAANAYTHKTLSGSFPVRNKYLEAVLERYNRNDEDTWSSIFTNEGSVLHLEFLSDHEKDVFKTAFEIDQRWLIEHAGDRTPYICQAQSLNIFLPADVHKRDLHRIHFDAWKKGVKSLYYCRSKSIQRAESHASWQRAKDGEEAKEAQDLQDAQDILSMENIKELIKMPATPAYAQPEYEECLACQ